MNIVWQYLDKRAAAINALKDYSSMKYIIEHTDEDIAKYSILHGNEQLFATKYKLYLPTEEELRAEIETQKTMFLLQQDEADRGKTE